MLVFLIWAASALTHTCGAGMNLSFNQMRFTPRLGTSAHPASFTPFAGCASFAGPHYFTGHRHRPGLDRPDGLAPRDGFGRMSSLNLRTWVLRCHGGSQIHLVP